MKGRTNILWQAAAIIAGVSLMACMRPPAPQGGDAPSQYSPGETLQLPAPQLDGGMALERSLHLRRSVRAFGPGPLTLAEAGQLLWAAQGVTEPTRGLRTAASAGALYPLEAYLVAGSVEGLPPGVYRYLPRSHELLLVAEGDRRPPLHEVALRQDPLRGAPATLVFSAVYGRTTGRYGERGIRYVHMEAGHAGQNALLQAVSLGLGAVVIGAFHDDAVREVLGLPGEEAPLYLIPVGRPGA